MSGGLVVIDEEERERGRRAVHMNQVTIGEWLERVGAGAVLDTG